MSEGEEYDLLVANWQEKFNQLNVFPLFEGGWMKNDRLGEFEVLKNDEAEARRRKDAFVARLRDSQG